jgi:hypothetical protein
MVPGVPGVVHQAVEPAEARQAMRHHRPHVGLPRDVGADEARGLPEAGGERLPFRLARAATTTRAPS